MKILQVCNKSPYPPKEGGPMAMHSLTMGLIAQGHTVKVLTIETQKYKVDVANLPVDYKKVSSFESVFVDTSIKFGAAFLNLFSSQSYNISRFISKEFDDKLVQILKTKEFDVVQLESLFVVPYVSTIRKHSQATIVLRAHNIEYLIWERITSNCANPIKKIYLQHLTKKLKNYELSMLNQFDGIAAMTKVDAEYFKQAGCTKPVVEVSFGVDSNVYPLAEITLNEVSLFHLGSMDWLPNQEGLKWFLNHVWMRVHVAHPQLKFYMAGRNMPEWFFKNKFPNVEVLGEVDDAPAFMNAHKIMIVPLLSGSGIRIKIIEGMVLEKVVITTSVGAEGIGYEHRKNILIADTVDGFCEQIAFCMNNQLAIEQIGKNARQLIVKEHNQTGVIDKLTQLYQAASLQSK